MKKHITLLSGLLMISGAFAQVSNHQVPMRSKAAAAMSPMKGTAITTNEGTEKVDGAILFQDDFSQSSFIWTAGTSGQGTFQFGNNSAAGMTSVTQYMGAMASTTAANGFAFFNGVQYLVGGSVDAQNTWVVSDTIDLSAVATVSLTFQQRYRAFNTDVTYVEFSEDGGVTWSQSIVVNGSAVTNAAASQNTVTVDFPVNNAQYGVVRFRWQNTSDDDAHGSGYGWCVDDIKIYSGYGNNVEMVAPHSYVGTQGLQYTKFPVSQSDGTIEMEFNANMKNKGYNDLDANLHVTSGTYDQTGVNVNVPSFMDSVVEVATPNGYMIPNAIGVHDFNLTIGSDSVLVLTTDDAATMPFEVTNWIMAGDTYDGTAASVDGSFFGFSSQAAGDLTGIGTYFEVFQDGEIGGGQVGIASVATADQATYIGQEVFLTLLKYNGTAFEYAYQSDPIEIAASHFGHLVSFPFADVVTVSAGDVYILMANSYYTAAGGGVPIMFAGYHQSGSTIGTTGEDFANDLTGLASDDATPTIVEAPVVRMDFQSHVGITEASIVTGVTTAPNPFSNETTVSFNLKNDAAVSLIVTDMTGRTVYTVASANMTAGAQTISIDGSALTAGAYNYSLKIGDSVITNHIVKK